MFSALFWLRLHHCQLSFWDEFSHWGPISRFIFWYHRLPLPHEGIHYMEYPPALALFHYFFYYPMGFSEGNGYFSQSVLILTGICYFLDGIPWKHWLLMIITILLIYCSFFIFNRSLLIFYADPPLSLFFAVTLLLSLEKESLLKKTLSLILPLAVLPLIKPVGLFFSLLLLPFIMLNHRFSKPSWAPLAKKISFLSTKDIIHYIKVRIFPLNTYFLFFSACGAILFSYITWHSHLQAIEAIPVFPYQPQTAAPLQNNLWFSHNLITLKHFLSMLLSKPGYLDSTHLWSQARYHDLTTTKPLPYFFSIAFWVIFLTAFSSLITYFSNARKKQQLALNIFLCLGFFLYTVGLYLLYCFSFSTYEGIYVTSVERYLSIYLLAWYWITIKNFIHSSMECKYTGYQTYMPLILLLCISIFSVSKETAYYLLDPRPYLDPNFAAVRLSIQEKVDHYIHSKLLDNKRIFFIFQSANTNTLIEKYIYAYTIFPQAMNEVYSQIKEDKLLENGSACYPDVSWFRAQWQHYDYLYVAKADDTFWSLYQKVTHSQPPLPLTQGPQLIPLQSLHTTDDPYPLKKLLQTMQSGGRKD
ncbi:MAG: hypothetical protein ACX932_06605 [Gammaproteobacteria bacterium]